MSIKHRLASQEGERPSNDAGARDEDRQGAAPVLNSRCVADVEPEPLEWLWASLIPIGKLVLFSGDAGLGKSFVTIDMASRVSRGKAWPVTLDGGPVDQPPGSVVFLACEDDVADTVRPRLDQANADVAKVHVIDSVHVGERERGFALDRDLTLLRTLIERVGDVRLLVIDPISAYFGDADSHKNADVRAVLAPLAAMAAELRFSVVCVNHLTKGNGKAIYRSLGSVAIAAASRVALNFYRDPEDEKRRLILPTKMNLAPESGGLAYQIENGGVRWSADVVHTTADEIQAREVELHSKPKAAQELSARDEAIEFLRERLADGPVESKQVISDAKEHCISESTLRRAYKFIGGKPNKSSGDGPWMWSWPESADEDLTSITPEFDGAEVQKPLIRIEPDASEQTDYF